MSQRIHVVNADQVVPKRNNLPWWTWFAPFVLIEMGDQLSLFFRFEDSYSAYYLPTSLGLVMIHWWGPARVLWATMTIGTLNSWFYATYHFWAFPLFGLSETLAIFTSWFLFSHLFKGKPWLPNTAQTILFIGTGLVVPVLIEVTCWEFSYIADGQFPISLFWPRFSRDVLSELITSFSFPLPVLYFMTPRIMQSRLAYYDPGLIESPKPNSRNNRSEITFLLLTLFALTFVLPFKSFWFLYGLFSLYFAIRFGFGTALLCNAYLFLITYLIPVLLQNLFTDSLLPENDTGTFIGSILLYLFATITGRVISDLRIAEEKLQQQNVELRQTNQELDRFVYSASHDLSAPLKSIRGLVNISRMGATPEEQKTYLNKIESSVLKLEGFIKEVLDYSRSNRLDLIIEPVPVKVLVQEIVENIRYADDSREATIETRGLTDEPFVTDKIRLKIILNNILTNALRYQKRIPDHRPQITVSSERTTSGITISIEDNGEGILPEAQHKIFTMFYRGHLNSRGSGLGLYIAKEAAEKLHGTIRFASEYGKGSVFIVELHDLTFLL